MGLWLSCSHGRENGLLRAVKSGDLETVEALLETNPSLSERSTICGRQSILHVAAIRGHVEVIIPSTTPATVIR